MGAASPAFAQIDGSVSVLFEVLPDVSDAQGNQHVAEMRTRLFAEHRRDLGARVRVNLAAYVDGLLRHAGGQEGDRAVGRDAIVRPGDLHVDFVAERFDVRAGMSRVVWGRLDELQPTDVVNPIDLSRFLLEGRSEARLPVALVRGRVFLPGSSIVEGIVVPAFRRSRFDQLEEETSPFNLIAAGGASVQAVEPATSWRNLQGGARFASTAGRFDWGASAYRGFRAFPIVTAAAIPSLNTAPLPPGGSSAATPAAAAAQPPAAVVESFPRFTMLGADFETVRGPWGVRGEVAAFVRDETQSTRAAVGVPGHSIDAGAGFDRRAGSYRVAANVLWARRRADRSDPVGRRFAGDEEVERTELSLVVALDRSFARETRTVRLFGVYDPADETVFARTIVNMSLRDDVALEASAGVFAGASLDTIGRLTRRDFAYARLKVFF
jgi:hypothetical protein